MTEDRALCPSCGSTDTDLTGQHIDRDHALVQTHACRDCGDCWEIQL